MDKIWKVMKTLHLEKMKNFLVEKWYYILHIFSGEIIRCANKREKKFQKKKDKNSIKKSRTTNIAFCRGRKVELGRCQSWRGKTFIEKDVNLVSSLLPGVPTATHNSRERRCSGWTGPVGWQTRHCLICKERVVVKRTAWRKSKFTEIDLEERGKENF